MLILASASPARRALLEGAGVAVSVQPAAVDESGHKTEMAAQGMSSFDMALALAEAKARAVSRERPDVLVIGADQMLVCGDERFDKPADMAAAGRQLLRLRGRSHDLLSAVAVASNGRIVWRHADAARLTMRVFSDSFLGEYLRLAGEEILGSVGAYRLEGRGAQLFSRIEGDYFTILGLPLLPLLEFLRQQGELPS